MLLLLLLLPTVSCVCVNINWLLLSCSQAGLDAAQRKLLGLPPTPPPRCVALTYLCLLC